MAFEQNQQDQFNMNNGIDQVKQFQAELDRATASIGAAELAAEEEQLNTKLQNLSTVQKARLKQLEQLNDLEEEGIQELAKLRQALSEKQFQTKKKDIERELKLAKDVANTLAKAENNKKPAKNTSSTKNSSQSNTVKDIVAATNTRQQSKATKQASKADSQSALLETNKTLHTVSSKLTELQNSVKAIRVQLEKDLQTLASSQLPTAQVSQSLSPVTTAEQIKRPQADSAIETSPVTVTPPTVVVEPTPITVETKTEPNIIVEPAPVNVEPVVPVVEPNIVVEPTPITIEPTQVLVDPNITVEPTPVIVEPQIDPTINVTTTPVNVDTSITVEPTPVTVEAPNVVVEYTPAVTEPAPIIIEPNITVEAVSPNIIVEPTPINIEPAQITVDPDIVVEPTINVEPTPIIIEPNITVGATQTTFEPNIIVEAQQLPQKFTEDLVQAAPGVETNLAVTGKVLSDTNRLLEDIIKASSVTLDEQEHPKEQAKSTDSKNNLSSLKNNGAQKSAATTSSVQSVVNNGGNQPPQNIQSEKPPAKPENQFPDGGMGYRDKVSIGENSFESILAGFAEVRKQLAEQEKFSELKVLNTVTNNDKGATSQTSLDLAGTLIENIKAAEKAKEELVEFEKDKVLNSLMITTAERQRLEVEHSKAAKAAIEEESKAKAKARDLTSNREKYAQENYAKLRNDFAKRQNELTENHYKIEAEIAYTNAHRVEILAQKEYALKDKYIKEEHEAQLGSLLDAGAELGAGFGALLKNLSVPEEGPDRDKQIKEDPNLSLLAQIIEGTKKDAEAADAYAEAMKKHAAAVEDAAKNGTEAPPPPEPPKPQVSQTTVDLGNEVLTSIEAARKAEESLQEFKKDQELNTQLLRQKREQERLKELSNKEKEQIEKLAGIEGDIAFNAAHAEELMAQKLQDKRMGYAEEYAAYQLEAGKYAVSLEDFEKNKAKKDNDAAKAAATGGITDAIKSGQFSKIFSADNKEAISKYMGQRTAELEGSYMAKFDEDNPEATEEERAEAKKKAEASAKLTAGFELVADAAKNLAQALNAQTDKIGEKQAPIDTRLQGSKANDTILGSYWKQLARDMNKIGAVNPYFKQEDFASNIEALVNRGISFDIKQRAFLMTIQEKIANTFDVADGTLLRLVRIQQQDTTAGRLGMESALNSFLNSMYETSEYLTDVASSVRGSLEEMQALMEGAAGTELEYQVQKWMGSLYSVGMSDRAVQDIASTFGQIASGDVSGLTGNGTGNLLIMAANEAGMSIADILQDGLNADETNKLMQAMVNYLAEIAETSSDSRVVQQQLASVYGVKASDLKAATNLASSIKDVSNQDLTYSGMLGQLNKMADSMILRTSTGEMLSNVWGNVQYTMATQMANDPILYLLPRMATLLEDYAGGIDLPFLNVMGFGVDLNTSVAQLMNVAAMSGSILGALGPMITGLTAAVSGSAMLSLADIDTSSGKTPVIARGAPAVFQNVGGSSISESGYIGNSSGEDIKNATLQDAEDSKKKQMIKAKDEETEDDVVMRSQLAVVSIYNLLEEVAHGSQSLRVRVINNNSISGVGGSSNGGTSGPIGEGSNNGSTGAMGGSSLVNGVNGGVDNGNWVLTF